MQAAQDLQTKIGVRVKSIWGRPVKAVLTNISEMKYCFGVR